MTIARSPSCVDLDGEELEEALELVPVAPKRRRERRGIGFRGLERAHFELQAVAELLHAAEDVHCVSLREA